VDGLIVAIVVLSAVCRPRTATAQDDASSQPNIIFILCDDLGWGDLGVLHQNDRDTDKKFSTPNIDAMAAGGAQLRNHYCPAPVCAPSRASLLLGQHQGNAAIRDNQFDKALPDAPTVASVLKAAGYKTAIIGKYGLQGDARYAMKSDGTDPDSWPAYPTKRGFDDFFGYVRHVDGHVHYPADRWELGNSESHRSPKELWHNEKEISSDLAGCYTTDLFTAYAKHWIGTHQANSRQPFFLYLAYDTPHAALQVPSAAYPAGFGAEQGVQWIGRPGRMINTASLPIDSYRHPETTGNGWSDVEERFVTMVRRIDNGIGDLLQTLKDFGIDENTLIVFSSDNGPHHEAYLASSQYEPTSFESYGPFDGTKRDTWEGGIRVPTLAHWPAKIPAGTVDESPSQFHDWMATFADAAGVPAPATCDGVSLLPTVTAAGDRVPSTVYVEYSQNGRTKAYEDFEPRKRDQKRGQMQVVHVDGYKGVRVDIQSHDDDFQIYDLRNDPKELNDLAGTSDEFRRLQQRMKDRVTGLHHKNESAPRPYDDVPVAAVAVSNTRRGAVMLHGQVKDLSYVPGTAGTRPMSTTLDSYDAFPDSLPGGSNTVQFRGHLNVPRDGDYTFALRTDHPSVLRLHDLILIDDATKTSATLKLEQGHHPIRVSLVCPTGDPDWTLMWSVDGEAMSTVPGEAIVVGESDADR